MTHDGCNLERVTVMSGVSGTRAAGLLTHTLVAAYFRQPGHTINGPGLCCDGAHGHPRPVPATDSETGSCFSASL